MVDVNLLPDELRSREREERRRLSKTPKVVEFKLTSPVSADQPNLRHGGSGPGRPQPPPPPPTVPKETLPPLPLAPPPPRPEEVRFTHGGSLGRIAGTVKEKIVPPLPARAPKPPPLAPGRPIGPREAEELAAAVRREVQAKEQRAPVPRPAGRHKPHRRTFWQWLSELLSPRPRRKPVVLPSAPPEKSVPPPPLPPARPEVKKVVAPPRPVVLPRPKPHRKSLWQWLASLFAVKPKPVPLPHPPDQNLEISKSRNLPAPPVSPRAPLPDVKVVAPPLLPPALSVKPHRRTFWQWLSALFARKAKPKMPPKPLLVPVKPAVLPPPPPLPRPEVKQVIPPPTGPVPPRPKPRRRTFWQWLRSLFAPKRKAVPPPPLLKSRNIEISKPPSPPPVKPLPAVPLPAPPKPVLPPPPSPSQYRNIEISKPPAPPSPLPAPKPKPAAKPAPPKPAAAHPVARPAKTIAINLIPEEFARHPELYLSRKFLLYLIAVGMSAFVIVVVSQSIAWYQYRIGSEIATTAERMKLLQGQIEQYQGVVTGSRELMQELSTMGGLLQRHRYWTQVFDALQRTTIDDVYFTGFVSASDGSLEMAARGKDYTTVARQLTAYQQATDVFDQVSITGAAATVDTESMSVAGVNFSVRLHVRPEIFLKTFVKQQP